MGMHIGMLVAFIGTGVAGLRTQADHLVKPRGAPPRFAHRQMDKGRADVCTVEVKPDAIRQSYWLFFRQAGIGAAETDGRTGHRFGNRMGKFRAFLSQRMGSEYFGKGHGGVLS